MNIYFAGSIRGGRDDIKIYQEIITFLKTKGDVLTEHVGLKGINAMGEVDKTEAYIYERDMSWLNQSDIVVAEVTQPSLGVGYELAYAENRQIPVICLFRPSSGNHLSAMIRGNKYFKIMNYNNLEEVLSLLSEGINDSQKMV